MAGNTCRAVAERGRRALDHQSGLLGLAGTADMHDVLAREDHDARLALDVYLLRLVMSVAAMTASLGGLDCLVFTGGVGENAPTIRPMAVEKLSYLGVAIDDGANGTGVPDADISAAGAA